MAVTAMPTACWRQALSIWCASHCQGVSCRAPHVHVLSGGNIDGSALRAKQSSHIALHCAQKWLTPLRAGQCVTLCQLAVAIKLGDAARDLRA